MEDDKQLIKKPLHFDQKIWEMLQKQAEKYGTTPSKTLDYILKRYYKI